MKNFANQSVPGHPELTSNKMAQIWNNLKLNNAKSKAIKGSRRPTRWPGEREKIALQG